MEEIFCRKYFSTLKSASKVVITCPQESVISLGVPAGIIALGDELCLGLGYQFMPKIRR